MTSRVQAYFIELIRKARQILAYLRDLSLSLTGTTSIGNSTTSPTGSFTGTGELNSASDVMVSCYSDDQDGTLYFDFSVNGTDWRTFPSAGFSVTAGIHEFHTAVKGPRYFRLRWASDSAPTTLQIYAYYGSFRQPSSPLNQSLGLDSDGLSTRPTDSQDEISRGLRPGVTAWAKFGHRTLLAAGGFETVWDTTGNYTPPTAATAMRIAYDGTAGGTTDGAGTTGATVLRISYIDSAGLPATLDHTLGTDGIDDTTETTLGINRVAVIGAGALGYNASEIVITAVTGGAKLAVVPATGGVTQQAIFHVGSNHSALFKFLYIHMNKSSGGSSTVAVRGYVYNRTSGTTVEVFRTTLDDSVQVSETLVPTVPFTVPSTGVLYFSADTSRNDAEIVVRFSGNEYQNT